MVRQRTDVIRASNDHADPAYRPEQTMKPTATRATREDLMNDFETAVGETEQLLKSVAGASQEQAAALRTTIEERIADATERLARLRDDATDHAVATARATDRYVNDNPWQAVGIGTGAGALVGLLLGAWIARR
jgi:ElaB/YqjD/DUF883 family membrane-anchored ribosome-binding protein